MKYKDEKIKVFEANKYKPHYKRQSNTYMPKKYIRQKPHSVRKLT